MKKTNKTLAIILAIMMVISVIPITASAAKYSGTCGDNLNWFYNKQTGRLTIRGTGAMYDYQPDNRPWVELEDDISSILLDDGITSIGDYAFYSCDSILDVKIPDSVQTLGDKAFYSCNKLHNVTFGNGLISIGNSAFEYCKNLEDAVIPDSTTLIGECAFKECGKLNRINIPNGVTEINSQTFEFCESLISIIIPDTVITIGNSAFDNCNSLTNVYYGGTENNFNEIIIGSCNTPLLNATIYCGKKPLGFCGDNLIYEFDEDTGSLTISGDGAMDDYPSAEFHPWDVYEDDIVNVMVNDGVTTIGVYAFIDCNNIVSITIPTSVTKIKTNLFDDGVILYYNGTLAQCEELLANSSEASKYLKTCTIICKDGTINDTFFLSGNCGDNLTWLFNEETNTLTISGTGSMYDYEVDDMSGFINQPWYEFSRNIKHIVIEDGVTSIGEAAFTSCDATDITIGDSVASIGSEALDHCNELTNIIVDEDNPYYSNDEFGVLFNKDKTTLIYYPLGSQGESYTIPDGVTTIKRYAFDDCGKVLKSVTVPKSVTIIEQLAISQYSAFTSFVINYLGTETEWNAIDGSADISFWIGVNFAEQEHKHNYESVVKVPTCTEQGYKTYTCECGDSYVDNYVDALGHNHTSKITTPATHTSTGVMTYTCTCGDTYTEVIAKLEKHNYESVVTAPTCTEQGYTTYTCECGDTYVNDYVDALGHTEETIPAVAPSCTETGLTEGAKCSVCDEVLAEQKELPANGHSEETIPAIAPTCTETGLSEGSKCSVCGETLTEQKAVDALGHTPSTAVEENYVLPTCTENGSKDIVIYCSVCDDELSRETVVLESTGHADNDCDGYCDECDKQLCDHRCHKNGFIWKIIRFINKIFGTNKYCECGVAHY